MPDASHPPSEKPRLAIVAPYPPIKSGVADYVAQQAKLLADFYQLILVQTDADADCRVADFPGDVIDAAAFVEAPQLHRRVLYHIGNSPTHLAAMKLLAVVPGIVILHDFFLSDVQQYEHITLNGNLHPSFAQLIYSHGFAPLVQTAKAGLKPKLTDYPCNLSLIDQAHKVMVHSDYVLRQAKDWYGDRIGRNVEKIGFAKEIPQTQDRAASKQALGFAAQTFLVATFGFVTPAKCLETLIHAWVTSSLSTDPDACLLVVGEFLDARYQRRIARLLALRPCANIRCLGYADAVTYQQMLNAVDLAVQLRTQSRGETSAALLDCMAHGVPVIANNHGFVEDLPEQALWKTAAQPQAVELAAVLEHLHAAQPARDRLRQAAQAYLKQSHDPAHVIEQLVARIEGATAQPATTPDRPARHNRQLLVDITAVARFDLRTGIQRVVRAVLNELIIDPPPGFRVMPIYLDHDGVYRFANQFMLQSLGLGPEGLQDDAVAVHSGDVYLGIDLHTTNTVRHAAIYESWRQRGVTVVNVLYDLLPVRSPQWFPAMVEPDFTEWARHIALNSDGVLAISKTVADDFALWIKEQSLDRQRSAPLNIGWFHLGSDVEASVPSRGLPDNAAETLTAMAAAPTFLMVGTLEPRKGHAQTLAAFEQLWAKGCEYNLVIVGKEGWHVEEVAAKIRQHPLLGQRLFWLAGISDEYLEKIYPQCTALIAASEGEGFGLPLIEAARHHIPVIARDIPVFREVGGEGAYYFKADRPDQLAASLQAWIALQENARPDVEKIRCLSWQDSTKQVLQFLNLECQEGAGSQATQ